MVVEDKNAAFYGAPESRKGISTEDWLGAPAEIEAQMKARSLLGRVATLAEVGNTAAFLASDLAGATTGTVFSPTSGTVVFETDDLLPTRRIANYDHLRVDPRRRG